MPHGRAEQRLDAFLYSGGRRPQLDGKFAAFGRVTPNMGVADSINHAPAEGEKPEAGSYQTRIGCSVHEVRATGEVLASRAANARELQGLEKGMK